APAGAAGSLGQPADLLAGQERLRRVALAAPLRRGDLRRAEGGRPGATGVRQPQGGGRAPAGSHRQGPARRAPAAGTAGPGGQGGARRPAARRALVRRPPRRRLGRRARGAGRSA
ncbi:unnamed protein product, partial [Prorocentrum cordatum]